MQNVVSFQFHKLQRQFQHLHKLAMYWTALNAGEIPRRSDLDPRAMQPFLPYIFILDQYSDHSAKIRISSVVLDTLLGEDAKGTNIKTFFSQDAIGNLTPVLKSLWKEQKPQAIELRAAFQNPNDDLRAVMVFFPLRDAFGRISKAIGGIETSGRIKYPPYSFDITPFSEKIDINFLQCQYTKLRPFQETTG